MQELPADWSALCLLVFLLGAKHGFDADHLAAIDGLTRLHAGSRRGRWNGALFSLGHGAVVMAVAVGVGALSQQWTAPQWLHATGAWISIGFLVALGVANLRSVARARPGDMVTLAGLKSRYLGGLFRWRHPAASAVVGALFALSFDTISQSALFAMTASHFGGLLHAAMLGALFVAGMLATDALNGLWISRLLARADATAARASRLMGLAVGGVSLAVAAFGAARLASPAFDAGTEDLGLLFGAAVIVAVGLAFLRARRVAAPAAPAGAATAR